MITVQGLGLAGDGNDGLPIGGGRLHLVDRSVQAVHAAKNCAQSKRDIDIFIRLQKTNLIIIFYPDIYTICTYNNYQLQNKIRLS